MSHRVINPTDVYKTLIQSSRWPQAREEMRFKLAINTPLSITVITLLCYDTVMKLYTQEDNTSAHVLKPTTQQSQYDSTQAPRPAVTPYATWLTENLNARDFIPQLGRKRRQRKEDGEETKGVGSFN